MASRRINQRILERLESFSPQQRREALEWLESLASRAVKKPTPQRARRRKTPGEVFWERLIDEGLYDGAGHRQD